MLSFIAYLCQKNRPNHQQQRYHVNRDPYSHVDIRLLSLLRAKRDTQTQKDSRGVTYSDKPMWIRKVKQIFFYGRIHSHRWKDRLSFTRCQSGLDMFLRMWQALVVTELAPEHQSNEKSQRSFTTHRFTDTFFFRSSLCSEINKKACQNKNEQIFLLFTSLWLHISDL